MIDKIEVLLKSELKIFFLKSYSLELLFRLHENEIRQKGIQQIYEMICSPKPKQPSFDTFIQFLISKGFVNLIVNGKDKRKKSIQLKKEYGDLLLALGFKQTDWKTFILYNTPNLFCLIVALPPYMSIRSVLKIYAL